MGGKMMIKDRMVAALVAFFFGWFGAHKFYLGENTAGVIYLLLSWTFIPGVIAFFECLGLLLTSDQAFDQKYNPHRYLTPTPGELMKDKAAALGELKKLYDMQVITAEEFEGKRRKILDSI
jgi:TM2 domain-containing membrane protein YozV